jgi:hypothetical protein
MSPDIELHMSGVFPDLPPVYRGHDGVRQFVARFVATWEELMPDTYRFEDLGDRVLTLTHMRGRADATGSRRCSRWVTCGHSGRG